MKGNDMRNRTWLCALLVLCMIPLGMTAHAEEVAMDVEIIPITAEDGLVFDGKLRTPEGAEAVDKLVIYVNGSGPNTYDNHRKYGDIEIDYYGVFAEMFVPHGAAFFSYNTRGVTPGDEGPYYADIDEAAYATCLPSNEVRDVVRIIQTLQEDPRLADAEVYLLGWSAGAIIAPQVALTGEARVDALLLAGYPNDTMADTLTWQQTGGSSMVFYGRYFDTDGDGEISREEYDADPYGIVPELGVDFDYLDADGDGMITREDFNLMLTEGREATFAAFEGGDDAWIKENYGVQLTSAWYLDFENFPPNSETLLTVDIPITIFHGRYDGNASVEGVEAVEAAFAAAGKDNLTVEIFDADHNLDFLQIITAGTLPEGFVAIEETVAAL